MPSIRFFVVSKAFPVERVELVMLLFKYWLQKCYLNEEKTNMGLHLLIIGGSDMLVAFRCVPKLTHGVSSDLVYKLVF